MIISLFPDSKSSDLPYVSAAQRWNLQDTSDLNDSTEFSKFSVSLCLWKSLELEESKPRHATPKTRKSHLLLSKMIKGLHPVLSAVHLKV